MLCRAERWYRELDRRRNCCPCEHCGFPCTQCPAVRPKGCHRCRVLNVLTHRLAHLKRANRDERSTFSPHPKSPSRTLPRSTERTPLIIRTRPTLDSIPSEQGTSQGASGGKRQTPEVLVSPVESHFASHQRSFSPAKRRTSGPRTDKGFLKSKLWLLGFFLMAAGELGNFLAYGFAPPSVVAPVRLSD